MKEKKKVGLDEWKHTFHRFRKQLKKAHNEITSLREQEEWAKQKIHDHLNICEPALFEDKHMLKRNFPIHIQIKNICRKNLTLIKDLRATKQQLLKALHEKQKE